MQHESTKVKTTKSFKNNTSFIVLSAYTNALK